MPRAIPEKAAAASAGSPLDDIRFLFENDTRDELFGLILGQVGEILGINANPEKSPRSNWSTSPARPAPPLR